MVDSLIKTTAQNSNNVTFREHSFITEESSFITVPFSIVPHDAGARGRPPLTVVSMPINKSPSFEQDILELSKHFILLNHDEIEQFVRNHPRLLYALLDLKTVSADLIPKFEQLIVEKVTDWESSEYLSVKIPFRSDCQNPRLVRKELSRIWKSQLPTDVALKFAVGSMYFE